MLNLSRLRLVRPDIKYHESFLSGLNELTSESDQRSWIYLDNIFPRERMEKDFVGFVQALLTIEHAPPPKYVKDTVYWALHGEEIVGRISMRHELDEFLRKIGGHIGYIVRPSYRKMGVASEMLRQMLETPRAKATRRVLLTCDESNVGSRRTIEKNGGVLEDVIQPNPDGPRKARYWIDV